MEGDGSPWKAMEASHLDARCELAACELRGMVAAVFDALEERGALAGALARARAARRGSARRASLRVSARRARQRAHALPAADQLSRLDAALDEQPAELNVRARCGVLRQRVHAWDIHGK